MKFEIDLEVISKIVITLIIGSIFIYIIFNMEKFGEKNMDRQTNSIVEIVNKALVQCYALEGSYPPNIYYLERYGVLFDKERFVYFYEFEGANIKPSIQVFIK